MASYVLIPGVGGDEWYWHRLVPAPLRRERDRDRVVAAFADAAPPSTPWAPPTTPLATRLGVEHR